MSATCKGIEAYSAARKKSVQYFERASNVLAGKVGNDLRYFEPVPLYIEHGSGGRKWDIDGNEYVDFLMGNAALLLGHAAPEIVEAIAQVIGRGTHFGNDHLLQIEWAELVQKLVPSGSARRHTSRNAQSLGIFRQEKGSEKVSFCHRVNSPSICPGAFCTPKRRASRFDGQGESSSRSGSAIMKSVIANWAQRTLRSWSLPVQQGPGCCAAPDAC